MLLRVSEGKVLSPPPPWNPQEKEVEDILVPDSQEEHLLHEGVFREQLLFIGRQLTTQHGKRIDVLALDQTGNGVVIELKRTKGSLGLETQALQYLAEIAGYTGQRFIRRFGDDSSELADRIKSFTGSDVSIADVNRRTRLILVARGFDRALPSLCHWLGEKGVPVRCIQYRPIELDESRYLDCSVFFDTTPVDLFPLVIEEKFREPKVFWFNIGRSRNEWWESLKEHSKITAGFENQPGDQGEALLTSFVEGDKIIAYASGHGAVGWALIENPASYELVEPGDPDDFLDGTHLHHLRVVWQATATRLEAALSARDIREEFGIHHPIPTRVSIDPGKAKHLIKALEKRFG